MTATARFPTSTCGQLVVALLVVTSTQRCLCHLQAEMIDFTGLQLDNRLAFCSFDMHLLDAYGKILVSPLQLYFFPGDFFFFLFSSLLHLDFNTWLYPQIICFLLIGPRILVVLCWW
jgi:hypothetical protein